MSVIEESVLDVTVEYKPDNPDKLGEVETFVVHESINGKAVNHAGGFFSCNDVDGTTYFINSDRVKCFEVGSPRPRTEED